MDNSIEYRVDKYYKKEITVEKSSFIGILFPCDSKEDFLNEFNKIKKEHNKAKHHCYAYIINNEIKYSDDGEPQGTAGKPILSLLENSKLTNCALVVVRYFGGVLLGSGRLLRTYVAAAKEVLDSATLLTLVEENEFTVEIDLDFYDIFRNYLQKSGFIIKSTDFSDKILLVFYTPISFKEDIESKFFPKIKLIKKEVIKHIKKEM